MTGIFIAKADDSLGATIDAMNKETQDWEMRAARGECGWVCADCCCSFPDGMPDECPHGHSRCTEILVRDKASANKGRQ